MEMLNAQLILSIWKLIFSCQQERENKKKKKSLVYERGRACVGWVGMEVGMEGGCDPTRQLVDTTFFHRQVI